MSESNQDDLNDVHQLIRESMFSNQDTGSTEQDLSILRSQALKDMVRESALKKALLIKGAIKKGKPVTLDFENSSDLQVLAVILEDERPPEQILNKISNYFRSKAEVVKMQKAQGRPKSDVKNISDELLMYIEVYRLKSKTELTWYEINEVINSTFREGKSPQKHASLMRGFRKYKNENQELFRVIEQFLK